MTEKDKKIMISWERAIKLERLKFSLLYSAFFGIFTFVFANLFSYFVFYNKEDYEPNRLIIKLIGFLITGFLLSYYLTWTNNNKKYNVLKNK